VDDSETGQGSFEARLLRDSQNAAAYAGDCYNGNVDPLKCNTYATPHIKWDGKKADCPFRNGICYPNNTYQMDTGLMDSHHDLGINAPQEERLKYRRVTTCSILRGQGYANDSNKTRLITWNYGPPGANNSTFYYNRDAISAMIGYTVE
jgi:hypothetical protein